LIRARTRAALQAKALKGEFIGGEAPFGWALAPDGIHLMAVENEQATIQAARKLRAGGLSLRDVSRVLCGRGFRPRRSAAFGPEQIRRMLADGLTPVVTGPTPE
jgi:DNA invertase Pin-like site-specific DNA recombinase